MSTIEVDQEDWESFLDHCATCQSYPHKAIVRRYQPSAPLTLLSNPRNEPISRILRPNTSSSPTTPAESLLTTFSANELLSLEAHPSRNTPGASTISSEASSDIPSPSRGTPRSTILDPGKISHGKRLTDAPISHSKRRRQRQSPSDIVLHAFLSIRPNAWRARQSQLGLGTAHDYENVVLAIIKQDAQFEVQEIAPQVEVRTLAYPDDYLRTGRQLAQRTERELCKTALQTRSSHFLAVLFFSYCAALEAMEVERHLIDSMMDTLTSFRSSKRACLRKRGKEINAAIITLVANGWSIGRATEIFFLFAINPSNLDGMASATFGHICRHFSTKDFTTYSFTDCLGAHMTIPGLLAEIMGNGFQSTRFYNALGYPNSMHQQFLSTVRAFDPAPSLAPGLRFVDESPAHPDRFSDEDCLLSLFAALRTTGIPAVLLDLTLEPQQRWDSDGRVCEQTNDDVLPKPQLLKILKSESLGSIIQSLQSEALLEYGISESGYIIYSLPSDWQTLRSQLLARPQSEQQFEALKFLCFICPRDRFLSGSLAPSRYPAYAHSAIIFNILKAVLEEMTIEPVPFSLRNELIEVMLSASLEGDRANKDDSLQLALSYMDDGTPEYLKVEATYRKSVLLRLAGNVNASEDCLQPRLTAYRPQSRPRRLHAAYGRIHISHLENLILLGKHVQASEEMDDWQCADDPTLLELRLRFAKSITDSKIHRAQGNFSEVVALLSRLPQQPAEPSYFRVICSLADAYTDLGSTEESQSKLTAEIVRLRHRNRSAVYKPLRRLLVSSVDAFVQSESFGLVEEPIKEIKMVYRTRFDLDISDQLLHVRVLIASARTLQCTSRPVEALEEWDSVKRCVRKYSSFVTGFTYAVACLSQSLMLMQDRRKEAAMEHFEEARCVLSMNEADYCIPGLVRWADWAEEEIFRNEGWKIDRRMAE